ncbi:MAG: THUMP domain-containing class I SAM-dependent RNA methyltransferase [Cyclobacteriaceae bacterium]
MKQKEYILVTCIKGANHALQEEILQLGFEIYKTHPLGVVLKGSLNDTMKLNLHLRTANRVLYLFHQFTAANPDDLYKEVSAMEWEKWIPSNGYLCVTSTVNNANITDTRFANLRTKDAIVDRISQQKGQRPDSGSKRDHSVVYLYWYEDHCSIYFDTSGETISKHGYRKLPFKAPLRESLAAALVLSTVWDKQSNFINPMCGSGTLAIEAALIQRNIPAGLLRGNFGFMHLLPFDSTEWEKIKREAKQEIKPASKNTKILASDINPNAINVAKRNAALAGVAEMIDFRLGDFSKTDIPAGNGVIMVNPAYGERLGEERELVPVYKKLGDYFKKEGQGYCAYVFSGNPNLAKKIGLRAAKKLPFFNGTIECRLLEYPLYQGNKKSAKG